MNNYNEWSEQAKQLDFYKRRYEEMRNNQEYIERYLQGHWTEAEIKPETFCEKLKRLIEK